MSVFWFRTVLWFALSLVLFPGCRRDNVGQTARPQGRETPSSKVLAWIGDEAITEAEVDEALKSLPEDRQERYRDNALHHLIETKVYADEARKVGLDNDAEIQEALERATNEVLARSFVKKHIDAEARLSGDEIKQYYEEHKDQFEVPEGVLIQQIVVQTKEKAQALLKQLKEGASFEELAKKKSIARSWKQGGHVGWLYKGRMEPELEAVAFDLAKGQLSDVIKTKEGYQIIRVTDKSEKRQMGLEEAKTRLGLSLSRKRKRKLIHQYYEEAGVDKNPPGQGVLVKVGDKTFTEDDLAPILAKAREREKEEVKRQWIRYFIDTTVFSKEARQAGVDKDQEVIRELDRRKEEILANAFRKQFILDRFPVTDEEVADYYRSHQEAYRIPLKMRVKVIVVKTKEEAEEILEELKKGAAFGALAKERSIDASASSQGELGWFREGEKDPVLEEATLSLEKEQISGIIKTEEGFEIIKLMDKRGGDVRPLEVVKAEIKMTLQAQKMEHEKERYYKKAGVKMVGL